jgi:molybdopterin converting factor small subunit
MATVHFPSGWAPHTGGIEQLTIDAPRVADLIAALGARFPALRLHLDQSAIAIDGQIYHNARYEPLQPDSEVHLLPAVSGGSSRCVHGGIA